MEKIICLSNTGGEQVKLEMYLSEGWSIKEMKTASTHNYAFCFVWIEKKE